jgi:nucleotide-binding universal stress UspA family protein
VKIEVPVGFAANIIVQRSQLPDVSQVVMATHGRTGVRRVLIGSVALEVLHHITQPLLLVRPTELVETAEEEATLAVQV